MSLEQFDLVFYGELSDGADLNDCKAQLGQLLKANAQQVDRMFSGSRVVLKTKLDQVTGEKYRKALRARGAECKLEAVLSKAEETSAQGASEPAQAEQAPLVQSQAEATPPNNSAAAPQAASTDDSERLSLAGEVADKVLANSQLSIDPVGVRLSEESESEPSPELGDLSDISIAPAGADLVEKAEELPVAVPDTSHLSIKE